METMKMPHPPLFDGSFAFLLCGPAGAPGNGNHLQTAPQGAVCSAQNELAAERNIVGARRGASLARWARGRNPMQRCGHGKSASAHPIALRYLALGARTCAAMFVGYRGDWKLASSLKMRIDHNHGTARRTPRWASLAVGTRTMCDRTNRRHRGLTMLP